MSILGLLVLGASNDGGTRPLLLILLVLAVIFLIAGAALAIVALRNQRKVALDDTVLEQLENEAS